jgi:hypothetical protein
MKKDEIMIVATFVMAAIVSLIVYFMGSTVLLVAAGVFIFIAALSRNKYLLMFLLFFIPLFPKINLIKIPGTTTMIRVEDFFFAFVIYYVLLVLLSRKMDLDWGRFQKLLMAFIGVSFVSLMAGILQGTIEANAMSYLYFLRRIEYISFFFVGYAIADQESISTIKNAIVPISLMVAVIALLQLSGLIGGFLFGNYIEGTGGRVFSTFGVSNELAAFIAMIFPFSVLGSLEGDLKKRFYWLAVGALQIFILFLSLARIEILSIPVGLLTLAIIKGKLKYVVIFMLAFTLLAGIMLPSNVKDRIAVLFSADTVETLKDAFSGVKYIDINDARARENFAAQELDLSAVERFYKWLYSFEMFKSYPVFGAGQSAFGEFVDNNYLRVLAENGIVGFAIFMMLIYNIWMSCIKVYNKTDMPREIRDYSLFIIIMLANMLVIALAVDVFELSKMALMFWLLVGVFFKAKNLAESGQAA